MTVSTAIPVGPITNWCLAKPWPYRGIGPGYECANSTQGTFQSDFQTFCCNGEIIDTKENLWNASRNAPIIYPLLDDLVCCGISGPQTGGLQPVPQGIPTTCTSGNPTPLASLAATNTDNAQPFYVTYTSASYGDSTTGDFIPTVVPYCLWAYTKGVESTIITVDDATISTIVSDPKATSPTYDPATEFSESMSSTRQSTTIIAVNSAVNISANATPSSSSSTTSSASNHPKSLIVLGLLALYICITV